MIPVKPLLLAALLAASLSAHAEGAKTPARPTIEMVFVLDTTGSMGGLIEGAKTRIWGIVNEVMKSPAKPRVKIGLVAYRDRGDQYVTQVQPLTSDLDKIYTALMEYKADGGGDEPEDVRSALRDGVEKAGWSPRGPHLAQVLFLVGDAPPHEEYQDVPDVLATTAKAIGRGIILNAIQCGQLSGTQPIWQKIARAGEGEYFAIAQDGGVAAVATPYDKRLGALGGKMGTTFVAYGGGGRGGASFRGMASASAKSVETRVSAGAPMVAQADRAVNKAINSEAYDSADLLQAVENGKVKVETLRKDELPENLQNLSVPARQKEVKRRLDERQTLRREILDLSKKRDAYLAAERKKKAGAVKTGFDAAVSAALKKQIARRGIKL